MDRRLRKRLIGAIVLAAFLVILVPEWLDGAGHKARYNKKVTIPESMEFKPIREYMQSAQHKQSAQIQATSQDGVAGGTSTGANQAGSSQLHTARSQQVGTHAWALQLGSFSQQSNAEALRDRFREKGYASYVNVLKKPDTTSYRVRIGPELDRERADKLREQVLQREKIKGMVVQHP